MIGRWTTNGCTIPKSMSFRLGWIVFLCLSSAVAQAATLRVSAQPPFSAERLGDALRSYLDGCTVKIEPPSPGDADAQAPETGTVDVSLRKGRTLGEEPEMVLPEVVLSDGEETVIARLPGALRSEDLYRAAALKVQALLLRRTKVAPSAAATETTDRTTPSSSPETRGILVRADLAMILPTAGPWHEALDLGVGVQLGKRWRVTVAAYVEPQQAADLQGVHVTSRGIPVALSLGYAWHTGGWQGWVETAGQLAIRRTSTDATTIATESETTLSPRLGGTLAADFPVAAALHACGRVSALAVLSDTRYHVDGQLVWPAARAVVLLELGLQYGGH